MTDAPPPEEPSADPRDALIAAQAERIAALEALVADLRPRLAAADAIRAAAAADAAALAMAQQIAELSPHAVRAAKRLLDLAGRTDLASGFAAEQEEIRALIGSPNQVEAVTARVEKRAPEFTEACPALLTSFPSASRDRADHSRPRRGPVRTGRAGPEGRPA